MIELEFTPEFAKWLWWEMNRYRTLWNDVTRHDFDTWYNLITSADSYWLRVLDESGDTVGVIYWTGMLQMIDAQLHGMFFDRQLAGKVALCKAVARWFFRQFPGCHRMTATVPDIYHATLRLLKRMGFQQEGFKRQSLLMYGNRVNEAIFGLLAEEAR